jgi:hypothetical protein
LWQEICTLGTADITNMTRCMDVAPCVQDDNTVRKLNFVQECVCICNMAYQQQGVLESVKYQKHK